MARPSVPAEKRFMAYVEIVGDHWLWIGKRFRLFGTMLSATEAAWRLFRAETISRGHRVFAACEEPKCVRHLITARPLGSRNGLRKHGIRFHSHRASTAQVLDQNLKTLEAPHGCESETA